MLAPTLALALPGVASVFAFFVSLSPLFVLAAGFWAVLPRTGAAAVLGTSGSGHSSVGDWLSPKSGLNSKSGDLGGVSHPLGDVGDGIAVGIGNSVGDDGSSVGLTILVRAFGCTSDALGISGAGPMVGESGPAPTSALAVSLCSSVLGFFSGGCVSCSTGSILTFMGSNAVVSEILFFMVTEAVSQSIFGSSAVTSGSRSSSMRSEWSISKNLKSLLIVSQYAPRSASDGSACTF